MLIKESSRGTAQSLVKLFDHQSGTRPSKGRACAVNGANCLLSRLQIVEVTNEEPDQIVRIRSAIGTLRSMTAKSCRCAMSNAQITHKSQPNSESLSAPHVSVFSGLCVDCRLPCVHMHLASWESSWLARLVPCRQILGIKHGSGHAGSRLHIIRPVGLATVVISLTGALGLLILSVFDQSADDRLIEDAVPLSVASSRQHTQFFEPFATWYTEDTCSDTRLQNYFQPLVFKRDHTPLQTGKPYPAVFFFGRWQQDRPPSVWSYENPLVLQATENDLLVLVSHSGNCPTTPHWWCASRSTGQPVLFTKVCWPVSFG